MFSELLTNQFMPHGHCYFWQPGLLWTHVASDALIAVAYFSIPITLLYYLRKRPNLRFGWVVNLFAAFIVLCGTTHLFGIVTVWNPIYPIEAVVKVLCAVVSVITAVALIPLVPRALSLRTNEELEALNAQLRAEMAGRIRAERALEGKVTQLEQSNEELRQFAYVVSHDLRAPLRSISGFSTLLKRGVEKGELKGCDEYLGYIESGVEHMQMLITDLLDLSQVQTAAKPVEQQSLAPLVNKACELLNAEINETGADIRVTALPELACDGSQFVQLFQNLIGNGLKFQPEGQKPVISVGAEQAEGGWRIHVSDNGIGAPEEKLASIFDIFQRLHAQSEYQGTGIGLAICQKIVFRHGGQIWAENNDAGGLKICFSVPTVNEIERPRERAEEGAVAEGWTANPLSAV